jgi:branched-chain amino acid transport system substrate-binding protein
MDYIEDEMKGEWNMLRLDDRTAGRVIKRRKMGLTVLTLLIVSVCLVAFGTVAGAADKGPIKIGFIAPMTGNWAQAGADMIAGAKMFLEETNYTVSGRKVEFIIEDEGATPATAITKARKLVNHDKVNIMAGVFLTPGAYAVAPICDESSTPLIVTSSAGDDLTQRKRSNNLIRVSFTGCQLGHVAGDYAYHKLGWRKIPILGWEHAFGQETIAAFQRVFEESGGKAIQRIYTPLTTLDFSPYVASLKQDADGLFEVVTVSPSMRFLKSLRASGLMDKWKVLTVASATDETFLNELGETGVGVLSVETYSAALQTPENIKFREKVNKVMKREPTANIVYNYTGMDWITQAIKMINGDVENREKFLRALREVEVKTSPRGPLKLDRYGHVIQNVYVRRVDKVGNNYQNTVLETYPMVSQFWKYNPEEYLKQPIYTRDNPPCKYCD